MSNDPPNEGRPAPGAGAGGESDDALTGALDDLEHLLEGRGGAPPPAAPPDDGQLSIPLLDEVVIPGREAEAREPAPAPRAPGPAADVADLDLDDLEARIAQRIASEVEVIVGARLELALAAAAEDIQRAVRAHLEIILPEVLDDVRDEPSD